MIDANGWRRPSNCAASECIEVRISRHAVELRGSNYGDADPLGVTLMSPGEWAAFVAAVKAGEYD